MIAENKTREDARREQHLVPRRDPQGAADWVVHITLPVFACFEGLLIDFVNVPCSGQHVWDCAIVWGVSPCLVVSSDALQPYSFN